MREGLEKQNTWEDFHAVYTRVRALRREIFEKAEALGSEKYKEVFNLYETHIKKIKEKFDGTVLNTAAGHALVGSSIPSPEEEIGEEWKTLIQNEDYPGEYSIQKFLTTLQEIIK